MYVWLLLCVYMCLYVHVHVCCLCMRVCVFVHTDMRVCYVCVHVNVYTSDYFPPYHQLILKESNLVQLTIRV